MSVATTSLAPQMCTHCTADCPAEPQPSIPGGDCRDAAAPPSPPLKQRTTISSLNAISHILSNRDQRRRPDVLNIVNVPDTSATSESSTETPAGPIRKPAGELGMSPELSPGTAPVGDLGRSERLPAPTGKSGMGTTSPKKDPLAARRRVLLELLAKTRKSLNDLPIGEDKLLELDVAFRKMEAVVAEGSEEDLAQLENALVGAMSGRNALA